jgi:predicted TIM-barrel fold metal-dependent hydrolase
MYTLFSVDDHIVEPSHVWTDRVPAKYRDKAPHVVEVDGRQAWEWEGGRELTMGLNAVAGKPREEWGMEPARFEDMIPGCYDPVERAKDLLSNGIFASVSFPTLPGFGGRKFATFPDKDLALACVRAWNDYMLEEWCAAEPALFVPMHILPVWDIDLCVRENERMVAKGSKAICFIEDPQMVGLPNYHGGYWEPLFASAQEAGTPVCMHIGSGGAVVSLEGLNPMTEIAAAFTGAARSSVNMMVSPIPRKYPDVKLVWSEGGIGWIPAAIERADRQWERHSYWSRLPQADVLPSEVARRNMWFCMIEEPVGIKYRHDFKVENILWESDYPHADTPFPKTQAAAKAVFEGIPQDEVDLITHKNAEKLFGFQLSQRLIDAHSAPGA